MCAFSQWLTCSVEFRHLPFFMIVSTKSRHDSPPLASFNVYVKPRRNVVPSHHYARYARRDDALLLGFHLYRGDLPCRRENTRKTTARPWLEYMVHTERVRERLVFGVRSSFRRTDYERHWIARCWV